MDSYHKRHSDYLKHKGIMMVFSSPSGAGKTTLTRSLCEKDRFVKLSISATTRPKRPGEVDGVHYHFMSQKDFDVAVAKGQFLEHAHVFGNSYGTWRSEVEEDMRQGYDVLFDIDWQGAQTLIQEDRQRVVSVFILPPSLEVLADRLRARGQDDEDVINYRMGKALKEISHWAEYDYVVVNDDLDKALEDVKSILRSERLKRSRQQGLSDFVHSFMAWSENSN
ncbi:MAG: guanylate kinase [Rickettsiales bacterium]|nr:guanylate kinase [Rickettsiales bacterium]|tara:strand:- start:1083 stop:1751 length:669 start_codon:yes stop_codon:yes gene_type:complete